MEFIDCLEIVIKFEFLFKESCVSSCFVFEGENVEIGYMYFLLLKLLMMIECGEKIVIVGCNGVGKLMLLKIILGKIKFLSGKISFGDFLEFVYFE